MMNEEITDANLDIFAECTCKMLSYHIYKDFKDEETRLKMMRLIIDKLSRIVDQNIKLRNEQKEKCK